MLSRQLTRFLAYLYNAIQHLRCRRNTQTKDGPAVREIFPQFAGGTV